MKRAASVSHDQPTAHRIKPSPLIKDVEVGVDAWTGGSLAHITWQSEGDVPEVTIDIVKKGTHLASMMSTKTVARRIANTGTHAFTVPSGLVPGEYEVRVASAVSVSSSVGAGASVTIDVGATPPAVLDLAAVPTASPGRGSRSRSLARARAWVSGTDQQLTWRSQGDVPEVNIDLQRSGAALGEIDATKTIARRVATTGTHAFTVPSGLVPGGYQIRVASSAARSVEASISVAINAGAAPPAIKGVAAVRARSWAGDSQQEITWQSEGDVPHVNVVLQMRGESGRTTCFKTVGRRVANAGAYAFVVPHGLMPGDYEVRVISSAASSVGAGTPVTIDAGATPPAIKEAATSQPIWHGGSRQRITWQTEGDVREVNLALYQPFGNLALHFSGPVIVKLVKTIARSVANSGSQTIEVPVGLPPGQYQLRIAPAVVAASAVDSAKTSSTVAVLIDDEHRERCVRYALLLLGLPREWELPYAILRKIAVAAATDG